jgi:hypothetical protein
VNIVKEYPGMQNLLLRAAQWLGFAEFQRTLLSNLRFCDRLLYEMHHDPMVPNPVRIEVYSTLLSPGPGGILAFAWLVENHKTREVLLKSYLDCLPSGPPRPDALDERATLEPARVILFHPSLSEEEFIRACAQLLTCNAVSINARQATFRWVMHQLADRSDLSRQLAHWATGQPGRTELPQAGEELLRTAYSTRIRLQEPFEELLELVIQSPHRQAAAESGLDLLETHLTRIKPDRRKSLLEQARNHTEARVRRRAYQMAESSEGEPFLRLGLRDLDAGVRAWVITRVTQMQGA